MKRLNSGQPDRQTERERERERESGEKIQKKKRLMTYRITFTVFDFVVCLFAVCSLKSLFKNIDCRYLLEPPFQVPTIYVVRKIPK